MVKAFAAFESAWATASRCARLGDLTHRNTGRKPAYKSALAAQLGVSLGTLKNWERGLTKPTPRLSALPLETSEAAGASFSSDGKFFAVASEMGSARVWDTKTWREVATLRGFQLGGESAAFSPDSNRLATGSGAGAQAPILWDTDSWQDVITLQGSSSVFYEPAFSPDGNSIGALNAAGILHVWDAPSWAEINAAEVKEKAVIQ
jgi:WD40 repeat protein